MGTTVERVSETVTAPLAKKKRRKRNLRWESLIGQFEAGNYLVVPLTCSNDLREEGDLMNHCVGKSYHRWCHHGAVRLFSIRDLDGRRLATVSLYYDHFDKRWRLDRYKGYGNRDVCEEPVFRDAEPMGHEPSDLHFLVQYIVTFYQRVQEIHDAHQHV
ncbi:MAG: PcfJ domain-containing protein [Rhodocyclales bacterium]|nr:PcfJ domain-containing protein [Rhodocyclales bacterium]